jgi:hypothetical protein
MAISQVDLGGGGGEEAEVAGLLGEAGEVVGEVVDDEAEPVELAGDGDVGEEAPAKVPGCQQFGGDARTGCADSAFCVFLKKRG